MAKILIVDDDHSLREVLEIALTNRKHSPLCADNITQAMSFLTKETIDLALVDLKLGQENGLDLLKAIQKSWPKLPVLMITAFADSKTAVEAIKCGARDYIAKPFDLEELLILIDRLLEDSRIREENLFLKEQIKGQGQILGESPRIKEVFQLIERIAPTNINVLITGESGTGKELIARAIHENSKRNTQPLLTINCGSMPETLVESELFGYRKGAFTGADRAKKGLLEKANHGSFFLDEVGEIPPSTQVKLLRCIQDGSFIPLGGTEEIRVDLRFIAATNREIEQEVAQGKFREDLFYRLSGVIIKVPPLRERGDDLFLLAEHFLKRFCQEQNKNIKKFSKQAKTKLKNYHFPGNIRELENIIERAVALETSSTITPSSLIIYEQQVQLSPDSAREQVLSGQLTLDEYLEDLDRKILLSALERTGGNKSKAAQLVGLTFRQFRYRLSKYKLAQDDL